MYALLARKNGVGTFDPLGTSTRRQGRGTTTDNSNISLSSAPGASGERRLQRQPTKACEKCYPRGLLPHGVGRPGWTDEMHHKSSQRAGMGCTKADSTYNSPLLHQQNGGSSACMARASCPPSRARGRPLQFEASRRPLGRTAPPRTHGGPPGRGAQRQKIAPAERPRAPTATGEAKRAPCRRRKGARGRLLRRLRSANKLRNRRPPALHRRAVRPDCVPVYLCVCLCVCENVCVCVGRIRGSALVV